MASEVVAANAGNDPAASQDVSVARSNPVPEACQVCGGVVRPYRHSWLRRCAGCGVLTADLPVAIPAKPEDNGLDEGDRLAGLEPLRAPNNLRLLDALRRHGAKPGQRLLDVGCGAGILLGQAKEAGFVALGVEPDANVLHIARRNGEVRHGYFPDALGPDETFDVIVFNDVFEHIPHADSVLAEVARRLRPGGLLCLNCPDKRGLFFRVAAGLDRFGISRPYDRLWQRGFPSPHVWYFEPAQLTRFTKRHGFTALEDVRLATVKLDGLWERIRYGGESLVMGAAAFVFTLVTYPIAALLPSDATACVFRKDA